MRNKTNIIIVLALYSIIITSLFINYSVKSRNYLKEDVSSTIINLKDSCLDVENILNAILEKNSLTEGDNAALDRRMSIVIQDYNRLLSLAKRQFLFSKKYTYENTWAADSFVYELIGSCHLIPFTHVQKSPDTEFELTDKNKEDINKILAYCRKVGGFVNIKDEILKNDKWLELINLKK